MIRSRCVCFPDRSGMFPLLSPAPFPSAPSWPSSLLPFPLGPPRGPRPFPTGPLGFPPCPRGPPGAPALSPGTPGSPRRFPPNAPDSFLRHPCFNCRLDCTIVSHDISSLKLPKARCTKRKHRNAHVLQRNNVSKKPTANKTKHFCNCELSKLSNACELHWRRNSVGRVGAHQVPKELVRIKTLHIKCQKSWCTSRRGTSRRCTSSLIAAATSRKSLQAFALVSFLEFPSTVPASF